MDTDTLPLSEGVQIGMRIPVILIGLGGVLVALLLIRRLGAGAALTGAAASMLFAVDQAMNILWVLHLRSMTSTPDADFSHVNSVNNTYLIVDVVLMTLGVLLLVVAFLLWKRPAPAGPPAGFPPPGFPAPAFPGAAPTPAFPGAAPAPGYPGAPAPGFPAPGYPAPGAPAAGYPGAAVPAPGFPQPTSAPPSAPGYPPQYPPQ